MEERANYYHIPGGVIWQYNKGFIKLTSFSILTLLLGIYTKELIKYVYKNLHMKICIVNNIQKVRD